MSHTAIDDELIADAADAPGADLSDHAEIGGCRHADAAALEQQHRTRNVLAVMRSVFMRTMETATSLEEAALHYQGRFDTISPFLTGRGLGDQQTYDLEMLIWDQLQRYPGDGGEEAEVEGPPERLPHEVAQPLALALHELATNAVKFGALGTPGQGHLSIRWWRDIDDLVLRWQETGVPIVRAAPPPVGFGREFIEQGLPYQIGGTASFAIEPGGVVSTIRIPLPVAAPMPAALEGTQP